MLIHLEYLLEQIWLAVITGYKLMDLELKNFSDLKMLNAQR